MQGVRSEFEKQKLLWEQELEGKSQTALATVLKNVKMLSKARTVQALREELNTAESQRPFSVSEQAF